MLKQQQLNNKVGLCVLKVGMEFEKIFAFCKNSLLPVLIMAMFFIYFFSISGFSEEMYIHAHRLFAVTLVLALVLSFCLRQLSVLTFVSVIAVSYIVINVLRYTYGEDYMFSAGYNIWSVLLFPNLLLAFFLFNKKEKNKGGSWFYIFLFIETAIIEKLQTQNIEADSYYFYKHIGMLNYPTLYIAILSIVVLFIHYIAKGTILSAAALMALFSVFMAMYLSNNLFAFNLFFASAVIIELVTLLYHAHVALYKDEQLGIESVYQYLKKARSEYPLKYSISLMYIDEYGRLLKRFGKNKTLILKKMFISCIKEANPNVLIYNYKNDALILAYMNINTAECFERTEDIRRAIAKTIFVFNENNHLQLTVSQCVSEKKRSDADAMAVLNRAEESLQKACKFTHNITIKA